LSGTFAPTPGRYVKMFSPAATLTTNIQSRDIIDNPFENLIIQGPGSVQALDRLKILGNVILTSNSIFKVDGVDLLLYGNWTNLGGTLNHTNSTAFFTGTATQTISIVQE